MWCQVPTTSPSQRAARACALPPALPPLASTCITVRVPHLRSAQLAAAASAAASKALQAAFSTACHSCDLSRLSRPPGAGLPPKATTRASRNSTGSGPQPAGRVLSSAARSESAAAVPPGMSARTQLSTVSCGRAGGRAGRAGGRAAVGAAALPRLLPPASTPRRARRRAQLCTHRAVEAHQLLQQRLSALPAGLHCSGPGSERSPTIKLGLELFELWEPKSPALEHYRTDLPAAAARARVQMRFCCPLI